MSGNGYANSSGRTLGCAWSVKLEKTSCGVVGAGVERMMLYRFVDAQRADGFPVRLICSVVGVSPSAYYAHKQQPAPIWTGAAGRGRAWWTRSGPSGRTRMGPMVRHGCAPSCVGVAG